MRIDISSIIHGARTRLIWPAAFSLLSLGFFAFGNPIGIYFTIVFGALFSAMAGCVILSDLGIKKGPSAYFLLWILTALVLSYIFFTKHIDISVTRTTTFVAIIVWTLTDLDFVYKEIDNRSVNKKERKIVEQNIKHQIFAEQIQSLIGDASQTKAFLAALEVIPKKEAGGYLDVILRSAKQHDALRVLQKTHTNKLVAKEYGEEVDEIAVTARAFCADSIEIASELFREQRGAKIHVSELKQAHEGIKNLREVSQALEPSVDESLRREIDALRLCANN